MLVRFARLVGACFFDVFVGITSLLLLRSEDGQRGSLPSYKSFFGGIVVEVPNNIRLNGWRKVELLAGQSPPGQKGKFGKSRRFGRLVGANISGCFLC